MVSAISPNSQNSRATWSWSSPMELAAGAFHSSWPQHVVLRSQPCRNSTANKFNHKETNGDLMQHRHKPEPKQSYSKQLKTEGKFYLQRKFNKSVIVQLKVYRLVAWHSGRKSISDWRTYAVLRSTCGWRVTTYVGKPSAVGQPTRPTQPFIFSRYINE